MSTGDYAQKSPRSLTYSEDWIRSIWSCKQMAPAEPGTQYQGHCLGRDFGHNRWPTSPCLPKSNRWLPYLLRGHSFHPRDWEPVTTNVLQALPLVEKEAEPVVQVCYFTLCSRDQWSTYVNARWMGSPHGFIPTWHRMGSCFMVTWIFSKTTSWTVGRPDTRPPVNHGTPNAHNRRFILFHRAWGTAWIETQQNGIWLRARSHTASHYTQGFVTTLHTWFGRCVGTAFKHFLLGSHNFMVTVLGLCVTWPLLRGTSFTHEVLM